MDKKYEILPKAEDGTYFNEHIKSFITIQKIRNEAEKIKKMREEGIYPEEEEKVINNNNKKSKPDIISPSTVIRPNDPSQVIKPPKEFEGVPTAREVDNDPNTKKPYYEVDFRFPEKIHKKKLEAMPKRPIYHSNELSVEELRKIASDLKKNPKTYKSKAQIATERKAKRKQLQQ